jgi:hypothetical protein
MVRAASWSVYLRQSVSLNQAIMAVGKSGVNAGSKKPDATAGAAGAGTHREKFVDGRAARRAILFLSTSKAAAVAYGTFGKPFAARKVGRLCLFALCTRTSAALHAQVPSVPGAFDVTCCAATE